MSRRQALGAVMILAGLVLPLLVGGWDTLLIVCWLVAVTVFALTSRGVREHTWKG